MWLIIRDLYQDLQAHVIHGGQLSSKFPISQGSGQGRILAPFMYKVYINSLIRKICDLKVGICLTNRVCSAPTFADDMTLLSLHASALSTLIRCAYDYCCKWRYEYHNEKSGIVDFGETPAMHGRMINTRKFFIGSSLIEEVKEYINLGIYKNYCGSFAANIDENITKARKKAGMLFSARFDRRRTNPLVYLKIWKQACIPCILFGSELWNLTPSDIEKLKRCQRWFVRKVFYLPNRSDGFSLQSISGLTSVELQIDIKKLIFFARIVRNDGMSPVVRDIFRFRAKEYFRNPDHIPNGFMGDIVGLLKKYDLHSYFIMWINADLFPSYSSWKRIVNQKVYKYDKEKLLSYASEFSNLTVSIFQSFPPHSFWSLTSSFPDLVPKFRNQVRLMGSHGLQGGIPWLKETDQAICPLCKSGTEDLTHFLLKCSALKDEWKFFWESLFSKVGICCPHEAGTFKLFSVNLNDDSKCRLLLGGLNIPFPKVIKDTVRKYAAVSVSKMIKVRNDKLKSSTHLHSGTVGS